MTIDKAIETLTANRKLPRTPHDLDLNAAMELGIEALKRFKQWRFVKSHLASERLQGETVT